MGLLDHPYDPGSQQWQRLIVLLGSRYFEKKPIQAFAQAAGIALDQILWEQEASLLWPDVLGVAWNQQRMRRLFIAISKDSAPARIFVDLANEPEDQDLVVVPEQPAGDATAAAAGGAGGAAAEAGAAAAGAGAAAAGAGPAAAGAAALVAAALDPAAFGTSVLWDDLPLIDRAEMRTSVSTMMGQGGRRALVVRGGRGMGKTYTRQFVRYVSEKATAAGATHRVSPVDASTRAGSPIDVRELAGVVAQYVVGTAPPTFDPTAQPQTVVMLFRTWLISEAEKLADFPVRWLIFDGFDSTTATSAANQLVAELAESATKRDLGPVRVIVLGFEDPLAQPADALVEPLRQPTDDDVKAFFRGLGQKLQGVLPEDGAIDVLFDEFTATGGPVAGRELSELGPSAFHFARAVFGGQP